MNAKNLTLHFDDTTMHVIQFGRGKRHLIMIPGLGDALTSIKGLAVPFSLMYASYGKQFRVTVMSRRSSMDKDHDTRQMAMDVKQAMDQMNIDQADILGISQGGMIAQHLAVLYPKKVSRLVLAVTSSKPNSTLCSCIDKWIEMIKCSDYLSFMKDNLISMYSENYCRKNLWMVQITGRIKPKSFDRFYVMAEACKLHNAWESLSKITCPVLILAGKKDQVVTLEASYEIKEKIPHAQMIVYPEYGHAVYDEEKRFHKDVIHFLNSN